MDPLTTQYSAYNQRRLHYSLLFWACLALQFSGVMIVLLTAGHQKIFTPYILIGLVGLSSFLMAIIASRLHRREIRYETHLRQIEDHWQAEGITGIEQAEVTGKYSSRKLVVAALVGLAICLCAASLMMFRQSAHVQF